MPIEMAPVLNASWRRLESCRQGPERPRRALTAADRERRARMASWPNFTPGPSAFTRGTGGDAARALRLITTQRPAKTAAQYGACLAAEASGAHQACGECRRPPDGG